MDNKKMESQTKWPKQVIPFRTTLHNKEEAGAAKRRGWNEAGG
jgi:hypothetical protein